MNGLKSIKRNMKDDETIKNLQFLDDQFHRVKVKSPKYLSQVKEYEPKKEDGLE